MKKLLCAMLACLLLLTGCTSPADRTDGSGSSGNSSQSSSADRSEQTPEAEPVDFTWQPKVYSDYQRQGKEPDWGPEKEQLYNACVDAMMAGEETIPCPNEELFGGLLPLLQSNFPVANGILADLSYQDGQVHISYRLSNDEREQTIREFAEKIEGYIEASVCQGDTPTMAAAALYCHFVDGLDYDYDAAEQENPEDVTPYRALMTGEGICQSFGPAYAYLCMQLGINAVEASGTDTNFENGHSWAMLELDGLNYFADPTFEAGDGGPGLVHFGMNSNQRQVDGGYPLSNVNIGFNIMWGSELELDDNRFAPLWDVERVREFVRTPEGMEIRGESSSRFGREQIPVEDGRMITVKYLPCES